LTKFRHHRDTLLPFLDRVCTVVQSDSFCAGLVDLELLEALEEEERGATSTGPTISGLGENGHLFKMPEELNLCQKLHLSPPPETNDLAVNMGKMFQAMADPDMVIVVNGILSGGGGRRASAAGVEEEDAGEAADEAEEKKEIRCHRVILAARCPYFRRALLSGMREAIER
jgi:hypothetical protein